MATLQEIEKAASSLKDYIEMLEDSIASSSERQNMNNKTLSGQRLNLENACILTILSSSDRHWSPVVFSIKRSTLT